MVEANVLWVIGSLAFVAIGVSSPETAGSVWTVMQAVVVAGSRYMRGGGQVGGPLLKRLMSRAAGLSLHWFAGVPIHDATNNFKLYRRDFLDSVTIESTGGFELAIELTAKAARARRPMAEVPTTWRDRTAGASRFKIRAWLPKYLRWYFHAFAGRMRRRVS